MKIQSKWQKIVGCTCVLGLLCGALLLFVGMAESQRSTEISLIEDSIIKAAVVSMEVGIAPENVLSQGFDKPLASSQKASATALFETRLSSAFASDSPYIQRYSEANDISLNAAGEKRDVTIEAGVSYCEVTKSDFTDDNHAIVTSVTDTWTKRINKNERGGYIITVPLNRDTQTIEMVKEDGVWKVVECLSWHKEFVDGEDTGVLSDSQAAELSELYKEYSNYTDAFAAAQSYNMINLEKE